MKKYRIETKENGCFLGIIEGKRALKKWLEDNGKYNPLWTKENITLKEVKESHKTEYTVFDSYDTTSDERMKEAKESLLENGIAEEDITDERLYEECYEQERFWVENEEGNLKRVDENCGLVAIADLGRWNGRFSGYKEIKNLEDVLYTSCDYERVYVDSNGDLRKEESHHDGSNSILYRYWKEGLTDEQKENFLDKIYRGECTQKDITRYTRKAGLGIANSYGWTVRGGENKYKKVA